MIIKSMCNIIIVYASLRSLNFNTQQCFILIVVDAVMDNLQLQCFCFRCEAFAVLEEDVYDGEEEELEEMVPMSSSDHNHVKTQCTQEIQTNTMEGVMSV